jgi:hypothetical protein
MSEIGNKEVQRTALYMRLGFISLLFFLISTNGSEIVASVLLARKPLYLAVRESLHYTFLQPIGSLLLAIPFIIVVILATELARASTLLRGYLFDVFFCLWLIGLYFLNYWDAQNAVLESKWTASALTIGLLPLKSIPVLVIAGLVVALMTFWKKRTNGVAH